jgi:serine/threonine-protein kinase RsbT
LRPRLFMGDEIRLEIHDGAHTVLAYVEALRRAGLLGFSRAEAAAVATAVLEVANNIVRHAGRGVIKISAVRQNGRRGISIVASDGGPGIPDIALAMQDGYSTDGGLGKGLSAIKRLMDEVTISSTSGGTTVALKKYIWEPDGR